MLCKLDGLPKTDGVYWYVTKTTHRIVWVVSWCGPKLKAFEVFGERKPGGRLLSSYRHGTFYGPLPECPRE